MKLLGVLLHQQLEFERELNEEVSLTSAPLSVLELGSRGRIQVDLEVQVGGEYFDLAANSKLDQQSLQSFLHWPDDLQIHGPEILQNSWVGPSEVYVRLMETVLEQNGVFVVLPLEDFDDLFVFALYLFVESAKHAASLNRPLVHLLHEFRIAVQFQTLFVSNERFPFDEAFTVFCKVDCDIAHVGQLLNVPVKRTVLPSNFTQRKVQIVYDSHSVVFEVGNQRFL